MIITNFKLQIKLAFRAINTVLAVKTIQPSKESKTLSIGNQLIAYTKSGRGKPYIFLIHGWGQTKETWKTVKNGLENKGTIYTLDLPGFGQSTITKSLTLIEYVWLLNSFLEKEKISSSILIGHSFGGKICTLFALTYPKKVEKLVLYSTSLQRSKKTKNITRLLLQIHMFFIKKSFISYLLLLKTYKNTHTGIEFNNMLHLLNQEVLLIYGKYDYIVPPSHGIQLSTLLPKAKYILFEHATHLAHIEEKEKFLKIIIDFVAKNKL